MVLDPDPSPSRHSLSLSLPPLLAIRVLTMDVCEGGEGLAKMYNLEWTERRHTWLLAEFRRRKKSGFCKTHILALVAFSQGPVLRKKERNVCSEKCLHYVF